MTIAIFLVYVVVGIALSYMIMSTPKSSDLKPSFIIDEDLRKIICNDVKENPRYVKSFRNGNVIYHTSIVSHIFKSNSHATSDRYGKVTYRDVFCSRT